MSRPNVRNLIVDAGLKQFHRIGYHGCSVEDITTAAGVPKGSFYNHFKSKEDLAVEVIGRYIETTPTAHLLNTSISPIKRLKQYFALMMRDFVESGYKRGCLLGNFANELADHSPAVESRLKAAFNGWAELVASVIKEGQDAGEIDSRRKPLQIAGYILSAYEGAMLRVRAENDPAALKDFTAITFAQLSKDTG